MKLICVDPRRTDTAELADLHLPLQPGTDVMLFHGLLHIMLWEAGPTPATSRAHHRLRGAEGAGARVHAGTGGADLRHRQGGPVHRGAVVRHLAGAR